MKCKDNTDVDMFKSDTQGIKKYVEDVLKECNTCQKKNLPKFKSPIQDTTEDLSAPGQKLQIDIAAEFPEDAHGRKHILNIVDLFSRKCFAMPIKSKHAAEVAESIRTVIAHQSVHYIYIQSDNGSEFINDIIKKITSYSNIKTIHGRPYHPQSQGIVERLNGELKKSVSKQIEEQGSEFWGDILYDVVAKYNHTPHSSLGFKTPAYVHNPSIDPSTAQFSEEQQKEVHRELHKEVYKAQRERFNKNIVMKGNAKQFQLNQVVLVRNKKKRKNDLSSSTYLYRAIVYEMNNKSQYKLKFITQGPNGEDKNEISSNYYNTEDLKDAFGELNTLNLLQGE